MMNVDGIEVGGLSVSRETFDRLRAFEALVRRWNSAVNLVSRAALEHLWDRHIVDSAQLLAHLPPSAKKWVDIGSGGGFPGLVVAIVARDVAPALRVSLVESDARKATFLRQAAQTLNLQVLVHTERIESLPPQRADVLSARALAPLSTLLGFSTQHVQENGVALFPKGQRYSEELEEARRLWVFDVDAHPSVSDAQASILVIRNISRANEH